MIYIVCTAELDTAAEIVRAAFDRSCGLNQSAIISSNKLMEISGKFDGVICVFVNPPNDLSEYIIKLILNPKNKILIFGTLPSLVAMHLGAKFESVLQSTKLESFCNSAPKFGYSDSKLWITYNTIHINLEPPYQTRPFLRYDFTDEWNNMGYGAVLSDNSIWSVSQFIKIPSNNQLAAVNYIDTNISSYAGFWLNTKEVPGAALWFNRAVGPVDSHEWRIVENFLSRVGFPNCVCQPVISEIPQGFGGAVTMRLDCDEDIESARFLWDLYCSMDIPFTLALHTKLLQNEIHHLLPIEILDNGGALLSHSATHAPNWGGNYDSACIEASKSAAEIKRSLGYSVRYAVAPFHQMPEFARRALADSGYDGCIGGIIKNDPDFLMVRSGHPPFSTYGFIGHSQQCMLHGDCLLKESNDAISIYKDAFRAAYASRTFFGYLDHPFSERYQYGWDSEEQRAEAHKKFIEFMSNYDVVFMNEVDAMDFLHDRALISVENVDQRKKIRMPNFRKSNYNFSIEYGGKTHKLGREGLLL